MGTYEIILFMKYCHDDRLVANKTMLIVRNIFLLENMRDIREYEYNEILLGSGSAGIIKL